MAKTEKDKPAKKDVFTCKFTPFKMPPINWKAWGLKPPKKK